ncbi:hypothetical protein HMSSN139_68030 [Paenibacillus sp. HMSSN-139]|nr:hypothetical protein HMSSN139_68030 [Paenibacillus sp. HMSSN-139]
MSESHLRGHRIEFIDGVWVYSDTKEPTVINGEYNERPCGQCGMHQTKEGHDSCLGTLKGVMNACCGHGHTRDAYVQLLDGTTIRGHDAWMLQNVLKKHSRQ